MQNVFSLIRSFPKLAFLASFLVAFVWQPSMDAVWAKTPVAQIGKNKIKLEVAQTQAQIEKGLMFRTSMPENAGMVFLFQPPRPVRFWMHNCYMSLDMMFVKDGKIVHICHEVPPCRTAKPADCPLYPESGEIEVSEVIEVNPGYAKRHEIKEGDKVNFEW